MSDFTLHILGCGSAFPTPLHNPSAQVIDYRGRLMMIDCGEGAQSMMRRLRLPFGRMNDIFISHMHGDHCLGLPGLLSTMAMHEKGGALTIHLPADGLEIMRSVTDYFCRESPYEIIFKPITGNGGILLETASLTVEAFPLYHRLPCYGFIFREKPAPRHLRGDMMDFFNVPVAVRHAIKSGADYTCPDGRVIENVRLTTSAAEPRSYAYCSDTAFDERVARAIEGVHTVYHEATYHSDLAQQAHERGHSTAAEAGRTARLSGARELIIGHYSKRYTDTAVLTADAATEFPDVTAAAEGMKIDIL